ncbi:DUF4278 domain-containing protein [Lyngbya aestuarii]|uniref:DUF4278 domain-containing protein n=1 Tax=Lyngbya aestuarii TaxID=118322 RepID=UPI00403E359C
MKLSYRGVSYDYNPPELALAHKTSFGKYRGLDWRFRNREEPPVLQPSVNLKYRGVSYRTPGSMTEENAEAAKIPSWSIQDKARSLMLDRQRSFNSRQQSMLRRSAAEVGLVPNHV